MKDRYFIQTGATQNWNTTASWATSSGGATGQLIAIDCDVSGTSARGVSIILTFELV
jgi:hypothetical protein